MQARGLVVSVLVLLKHTRKLLVKHVMNTNTQRLYYYNLVKLVRVDGIMPTIHLPTIYLWMQKICCSWYQAVLYMMATTWLLKYKMFYVSAAIGCYLCILNTKTHHTSISHGANYSKKYIQNNTFILLDFPANTDTIKVNFF